MVIACGEVKILRDFLCDTPPMSQVSAYISGDNRYSQFFFQNLCK